MTIAALRQFVSYVRGDALEVWHVLHEQLNRAPSKAVEVRCKNGRSIVPNITKIIVFISRDGNVLIRASFCRLLSREIRTALLQSSKIDRDGLSFNEMNALAKAQILRFTEKAIELARRAVFRYSSSFSSHRYTVPRRVVLLCLKIRKATPYRGLLDELIEMPRIRRTPG